MNLSTLIGSGANPYLEYGWVTYPSFSDQTLTTNAITTLTLDTKVTDVGNFGSISSNLLTLASGTYLFEAFVRIYNASGGYTGSAIFSLYNTTDSSYVSRTSAMIGDGLNSANSASFNLKGQFTIASTKAMRLQILPLFSAGTLKVGSAIYNQTFTGTTLGDDQRTTIKLWKLA